MIKNRKKFMEEFKTFAMRGNVIDLAVGVIIGTAFQKIVSSLVNDLIMPIIGVITGGSNFNEQFLILRVPQGVERNQIDSLKTAAALGASTFNYGAFLTTIIDFLIVALVIFIMVKAINKLNAIKKKEEEPKVPSTKKCPYCTSEIAVAATRCPHCTSELDKI